ncbi:hypothetical protein VTK73DRAFT_5703 [Phialemonium thermophilum]|uniref:Transmembrane protein n=1 Tax=Phialemonium thermophilum TaxID=223376 RepID=A0ABR3V0Q9_9PEZI
MHSPIGSRARKSNLALSIPFLQRAPPVRLLNPIIRGHHLDLSLFYFFSFSLVSISLLVKKISSFSLSFPFLSSVRLCFFSQSQLPDQRTVTQTQTAVWLHGVCSVQTASLHDAAAIPKRGATQCRAACSLLQQCCCVRAPGWAAAAGAHCPTKQQAGWVER